MADNNYQSPAPMQQKNGMAIASLVLGIVAFVLSCFPIVGLVGGVVGLVLGIMGLKNAGPSANGKGMAIAGIILSALGLVGAIIWMVFSAAILAAAGM